MSSRAVLGSHNGIFFPRRQCLFPSAHADFPAHFPEHQRSPHESARRNAEYTRLPSPQSSATAGSSLITGSSLQTGEPSKGYRAAEGLPSPDRVSHHPGPFLPSLSPSPGAGPSSSWALVLTRDPSPKPFPHPGAVTTKHPRDPA